MEEVAGIGEKREKEAKRYEQNGSTSTYIILNIRYSISGRSAYAKYTFGKWGTRTESMASVSALE